MFWGMGCPSAMITSLNMFGGSLYGELQCIMGNGHMGPTPSCEQTDRQTDTTLLAGCKLLPEVPQLIMSTEPDDRNA